MQYVKLKPEQQPNQFDNALGVIDVVAVDFAMAGDVNYCAGHIPFAQVTANTNQVTLNPAMGGRVGTQLDNSHDE